MGAFSDKLIWILVFAAVPVFIRMLADVSVMDHPCYCSEAPDAEGELQAMEQDPTRARLQAMQKILSLSTVSTLYVMLCGGMIYNALQNRTHIISNQVQAKISAMLYQLGILKQDQEPEHNAADIVSTM